MNYRYLPVMVRGYPIARSEHSSRDRTQINTLLVDDTETATDIQRLLFGTGMVYDVAYFAGMPHLMRTRAILYYADDLTSIRPETYKALRRYVKRNPEFTLMSHSNYLKKVFRKVALDPAAAIAGFNLSFDMWRHTSSVGVARGSFFYGGLSGEFLNGEDPSFPRYRELPAGIGMKREFSLRRAEKRVYCCQLIDLSELARSLTGSKHNLRSAGIAFGCSILKYSGSQVHDPEINYSRPDFRTYLDHYVSYGVNDVDATADLWCNAMRQHLAHPIRLNASGAFSPASYAKQYIRDMGIHAALCICPSCRKSQRGGHRIGSDVLGASMAAFLGGRAEVGIRLTDVPCVLVDFTSMHPTNMVLQGIWELLTAERIECREETAEIQEMLDSLSRPDLLNRENYRRLCGIAELVPDDDLLPVRAGYDEREGGAPGIGINYLTSDRKLAWSLNDLAACKILTGKSPRISKAWRFYPAGRQRHMTSIEFMSRLRFDPNAGTNLIRFLVEERAKAKKRHSANSRVQGWNRDEDICLCEDSVLGRFLKVFVNSIYGVFAEMNHNPKAEPITGTVLGPDCETWSVKDPEVSGEYCFPAFASIITGGSRLMLAMLQARVQELGSHLVFMDTDSGCIPATADGGTEHGIKLLTYAQVDTIREEFDGLNPYDPAVIPQMLKWEYPKQGDGPIDPVRVVAISAKRYALYRRSGDDIEIVKRSEHGLGLYLNPLDPNVYGDTERKPDWISEVWKYIIRTEVYGEEPEQPYWFDYPAMTALPVRTRHVWQSFKAFNEGKATYERIIPYDFHLAVHPSSIVQDAVRLIAPFTTDARAWLKLPYTDIHTGRSFQVTTDAEEFTRDRMLVKDYREVLYRYVTHPENKYDGMDGKPCTSRTTGQLQPCHIVETGCELITKDSTSLLAPNEIFEYKNHRTYHSTSGTRVYIIAREFYRLHKYSYRRLALELPVTDKQARAFMSDTASTPRAEALTVILKQASTMARAELNAGYGFISPTLSVASVLARWHSAYQADLVQPVITKPVMPVMDADDVVFESIDVWD